MKSADNIKIYTYWSDAINSEKIEDFIKIQNAVFSRRFNYTNFKTKYLENIYGPSIVILAYLDTKCIGARAFWRNDLADKESYQPCDSAVITDYQGMGIFSRMTKAALEEIDDTTYIYNFPNDNSLGAYKRLDWKVVEHKKYRLYKRFIDHKSLKEIDIEYLEWMLSSNNKMLYYTEKKGETYLLYKRKYNLFLVIGQIPKSYIKYLEKAQYPILLVYATNGRFGRGVVTVTRNIPPKIDIPIHKFDTLF